MPTSARDAGTGSRSCRKVGLDDVSVGLGPAAGPLGEEARAVGATCGGLRVWSVYVPNGRTVDDPMYEAKLTWLGALADEVAAAVPKGPFVVAGDFNIAPTDVDVWDPSVFVGATHVTGPERAALDRLKELGLVDLVRERWPAEVPVFSYWDYRAGAFHQDLGMRIDLLLGTPAVASRLKAAYTDRAARKGKDPSDHAPVIVDLDEAPDGDIGPVVPPPSLKGSSAKEPEADASQLRSKRLARRDAGRVSRTPAAPPWASGARRHARAGRPRQSSRTRGCP